MIAQQQRQANMNLAQQNNARQGGAGGNLNRQQVYELSKAHMQEKVLQIDEYDRRVWSYLQDVPYVYQPVAYVCAALNLFLPGFGTAIAACASQSQYVSKTQLCVAFMQFLTSLALIGWIWSIYWGYLIVIKSHQQADNIKRVPGQQ